METTGKEHVVVVGAGIAGLTAAYRMQQAGLDVTVLEADDRVGGRMTSDEENGCIIDRGAQFLSAIYENVIPLVKECGLEEQLVPTSPWAAVVKDGKPRRIRLDRPHSVPMSGLLRFRDWVRVGWQSVKIGQFSRCPPLDDYSAWADFDDEDAAEWCEANLGEDVTEYVMEPNVQGFFFLDLEGTSRVIPMILMAFNGNMRHKTMTLKGGIGTLPEALAEGLNVKLSSPVEQIRVERDGVEVRGAGKIILADYVVLATTASVARRIYPQVTEPEGKVMSATYSSTVNICLASDRHWRDLEALKDVYGLLIPRSERDTVAAIAVESWKEPSRTHDGELLDIMLAGGAAEEMIDGSDEEILSRVVPEVDRYFPRVSEHIRSTKIIRWREAMPKSPVGRSRSIAKYRSNLPPESRVLLAGDYMGTPSIDGAAGTGAWAAEQILHSLNDRADDRRPVLVGVK